MIKPNGFRPTQKREPNIEVEYKPLRECVQLN